SKDYLTNDNDQAVVEICITRITTAIRETRSIEKHGLALVSLWESCLEYNLKPHGKDDDTPHAKIASDIMSCILQNYNKPPVMALAVPVAVKFLWHGNMELCRNMSSYLSLAAIAKADLLADHTEAITKSILQGNYMLLRVLPSVYEKQPQSINSRVPELVELMDQLDQPEQQHLLRLLQIVAKQHPQERARSCLVYLVSLLASMEHTFHHTLLLEIKGITDTFSSILGAYSKDIYRMSNSFTAIAKLLVKKLESYNAPTNRTDDETEEAPKSCDLVSAISDGDENEKLEVKIQAFEETLASENNSPGLIRRYSLGQTSKEERKEMRFNRSKSLALHAVHTKSVNSENGHEREYGEMHPGISFSERSLSQESCRLPLGSDQDASTTEVPSSPHPCAASIVANSSAETYEDSPADTAKCTGELQDQLFLHLKENLCTIQTYYAEMVKRIPVPEQCLIEVVNLDGKPLIESKLKEKQVRWKFIKRWKTRYFTLAGNQLLFLKGKSKDDLDDNPIELSEVQSVKVVARKRRDWSLPRAFEIFTDNKTYVLKLRMRRMQRSGCSVLMWQSPRQRKERAEKPQSTFETESCPQLLQGPANDERLHRAAWSGSLEQVKALLTFGIPVNCQNSQGWTPLHHASFCGHQPLVKFLLHRGTDINSRDFFNCTPLHRATWNGQAQTAEYLLQHGASHAIRACSGQTPLHLAAANGHGNVARTLLEHKAQVDCKDINRWSPLHWASFNGNLDVIDLLLSNGGAVNEKNNNGMTPLHLAVLAESHKTVEHLLRKGADLNAKCENGRSALHLSAATGNKKRERKRIMQLLLERGATVDAADKDLVTPLHLAAGCGSCIAVHLLMQYGGSVGSTDLLEMTPLHYSALNGFAETAKILLCYGADKNAKERLGNTPLHLASQKDQIQVLVVLLKSGADASLQSKWKETAADIAVQKQHTNALRLIQASTKQQTNS
ncbi:Ventricular zone-expressed PH domain-containing protein-like 1, partial [Acipenser ruthenus]